MGLFNHKKDPQDEAAAAEEHFFDEYYREELRNHGRWYFEKVIKENGVLFKQDLDATVAQINNDLKEHLAIQLDETIVQVTAELKGHVVKRFDEQFIEYGKAMKEAQDSALESLNSSAQSLQDQHQKLSDALQKSIADQDALLTTVSNENKDRIVAMEEAQKAALESLNRSAEAMEVQYKSLQETLEKNVATQEEVLVGAFEQNMAQIIEHYLLGALGDQYDLKAQVPSIIKQMEENKQAIVDDMKL